MTISFRIIHRAEQMGGLGGTVRLGLDVRTIGQRISRRPRNKLFTKSETIMGTQENRNEAAAKRAKRDLERVNAQGDTIGTSAAARMATKMGDRFKASDVDQDDKIEVLGTRIGRGLGLIAFIGLAIYLFITYVLN